MASPAVTAFLLALAALAAVEAVVQLISDNATSDEMKKWLNSIRIESEGLSDKLWGPVIKGKTSKGSINDLLTKVTAQTNNILSVHKALNNSTIHGCTPNFFADYQVQACEKNARTTYLPQLQQLYTDQQPIITAVNKFVANLA